VTVAGAAPPAIGSLLREVGWVVVESFMTSSECDALGSALMTRGWPRVSPELAKWIRDPRWGAVTLPYLGPDVRFIREQLLTKAPRSQEEVPWHQDSGYARVAGEFLTCFLALDDVSVDNGCLWIVSASHLDGLVPHVPDGYLRTLAVPPDHPGQPVPLTRGSVVVFSSLALHRSGANHTGGTRPAWMVQFAGGDVRDVVTGDPAPGCPLVAQGGQWRLAVDQ
jgi:phytanoyl-CoA dioxygenase PhyH